MGTPRRHNSGILEDRDSDEVAVINPIGKASNHSELIGPAGSRVAAAATSRLPVSRAWHREVARPVRPEWIVIGSGGEQRLVGTETEEAKESVGKAHSEARSLHSSPGAVNADRTPGMMACQTRWPFLVECAAACTDTIRTIPNVTPCERGSKTGNAACDAQGDGGIARSPEHLGVSGQPRPPNRGRGDPSAICWLGRHRLCSSAWRRSNRVGLERRSSGRSSARGESRTPTPFRAPDPKSGASAVPPLSR